MSPPRFWSWRRWRFGGAASQSRSNNNFNVSLGATWEPDVWGALRLAVTGAQASAEASAANLAAARLSAQAAVATDYFALREADNEIALLRAAADAYARALRITYETRMRRLSTPPSSA